MMRDYCDHLVEISLVREISVVSDFVGLLVDALSPVNHKRIYQG